MNKILRRRFTATQYWVVIPLILFMILVVFLWHGLSLDPYRIDSVMIAKPVPNFKLSLLFDATQQGDQRLFQQQVSILHVWATWCPTCLIEHDTIVNLSKQYAIPFYALNYKDDRNKAQQYLKHHGNPYRAVLFDGQGQVAINLGVYGTPESFVIDRKGIIRYKHVGMITLVVWQQTLLPLIQKLETHS